MINTRIEPTHDALGVLCVTIGVASLGNGRKKRNFQSVREKYMRMGSNL